MATLLGLAALVLVSLIDLVCVRCALLRRQWAQLADLYLERRVHDLARFCLEECVLMAPFNPIYHCRLGEVFLAQEDFVQARRHFSMAIKVSEAAYTRALFGLALATKHSVGRSSSAGGGGPAVPSSDTSAQLHAFACEKLDEAYGSNSLKDIVKTVL